MKSSWRDLAVMGGRPEFDSPVVVGKPNLGNEKMFLDRIGQIFACRQLTNNGPFVREFEERIARFCGVRNCIATCNATLGLELAIAELGMTGSVIVPSLTFIGTAHTLQRNGVTPIFCDVDPATHVIDPAAIEALIRPDTSGILGVHLWGNPCPVEGLEALAEKHGLRLLFDAAHAFGSTYRGRLLGGFGDAEVFSFHATKAINSFEGGAIVTNDDLLAARLREAINFGLTRDNKVARLGTNAKMNEACAAMGITSLDAKDEIFAHNRSNYAAYRDGLKEIPGLRLLPIQDGEASNCQFVVVEVDAQAFGWTRDELIRLLEAENVVARRYFYPGCHRSEPYCSQTMGPIPDLPITDKICSSVFCLPTGTSVSPDDVAGISRIIRLAARPAPEMKTRFAC
jgi:dTDP-4-amino-4,6-dideoxygalactose transaminase